MTSQVAKIVSVSIHHSPNVPPVPKLFVISIKFAVMLAKISSALLVFTSPKKFFAQAVSEKEITAISVIGMNVVVKI